MSGLEHGLRCANSPCKPPRFSLSLTALAKGFARNGRSVCNLKIYRPQTPLHRPKALALKVPDPVLRVHHALERFPRCLKLAPARRQRVLPGTELGNHPLHRPVPARKA